LIVLCFVVFETVDCRMELTLIWLMMSETRHCIVLHSLADWWVSQSHTLADLCHSSLSVACSAFLMC